MNPVEYEIMARFEDDHWWYCGLRDLFTRILRRAVDRREVISSVLDIGCGTGANLKLLQSIFSPVHLSGFDVSPLAVSFARSKVPAASIYQSDLCAPIFHSDVFDVILCSDVLYMTELQEGIAGLAAAVSRLRVGGLFLLHLPALDWLYSRHDVAVHTRHRFTRREVAMLMSDLGLKVELLTYRMFVLFPAIVAARLPSLLFGIRSPPEDARSDLRIPWKPLNRTLFEAVKAENQLISRGFRFPVGSSVIALGRKT